MLMIKSCLLLMKCHRLTLGYTTPKKKTKAKNRRKRWIKV